MREIVAVLVAVVVILAAAPPAPACTNILVTPGASADGSAFVTYAADSHEFYGDLPVHPGGLYPEADCPRVRSLGELAAHMDGGSSEGEFC